jgi:hypothetical protein
LYRVRNFQNKIRPNRCNLRPATLFGKIRENCLGTSDRRKNEPMDTLRSILEMLGVPDKNIPDGDLKGLVNVVDHAIENILQVVAELEKQKTG